MKIWIQATVIILSVLLIAGVHAHEDRAQEYNPQFVTVLAWSPNGNRIASSDYTNVIRVWDTQLGEQQLDLTGHTSYITKLAWSPDGTRLASASNDETTLIWDTTNGQRLFTLGGHGQSVAGVTWSLDGNQVITGTDGIDVLPYLRIWDTTTGQLRNQVSASTTGVMVWRPDGRMLAISGSVSIQLRNAITLELVNTLTQNQDMDFERDYEVTSLTWSPDGSEIASGYLNGKLRVWDVGTGQVLSEYQANESQPDHNATSAVIALEWQADGINLSGASVDGTIRTWDTITGEVEETIHTNGRVYGASFSSFGGRLALGGVPNNGTSETTTLPNSEEVTRTFANGSVQIVVPAPSLERLQAIVEACNAPSAVEQSLNARIQADQLTDFVAQVEALPEDTIPPACAADLIAVAEALQSQ